MKSLEMSHGQIESSPSESQEVAVLLEGCASMLYCGYRFRSVLILSKYDCKLNDRFPAVERRDICF